MRALALSVSRAGGEARRGDTVCESRSLALLGTTEQGCPGRGKGLVLGLGTWFGVSGGL